MRTFRRKAARSWRKHAGWMVSDPFTCQGRAHAGGPVQLHGDGRNAAGQETQTVTFSQWEQQQAGSTKQRLAAVLAVGVQSFRSDRKLYFKTKK